MLGHNEIANRFATLSARDGATVGTNEPFLARIGDEAGRALQQKPTKKTLVKGEREREDKTQTNSLYCTI